jgi:hypothetical protein
MSRVDTVSRVLRFAALAGGAALAVGLASVEGVAHHPGSHATRQPDGRVRLEVTTTATDACTTIGEIRRGVPPGTVPPLEGDPVTVQMRRPAGAICAQVLGTARAEAVLDTPPGLATLHLFVLAPDRRLAGTERVAIR